MLNAPTFIFVCVVCFIVCFSCLLVVVVCFVCDVLVLIFISVVY